MAETFLPMYQSSFCDAKAPVKADSGLTYNIPVPRKRSRDWMSNQQSVFDVSSLFGEELSLQMQQQQLEIDRFIAENVRNLNHPSVFYQRFRFRKLSWIEFVADREGEIGGPGEEKAAVKDASECNSARNYKKTERKRRGDIKNRETELDAPRKSENPVDREPDMARASADERSHGKLPAHELRAGPGARDR